MTEPRADRPHVPGYGIPTSVKGTLPWSWARERLEGTIVYWLATTGSDGAPHVIPIWGAWVGDRWYVEGGPTRWQRNLRENPRMARARIASRGASPRPCNNQRARGARPTRTGDDPGARPGRRSEREPPKDT